MFRRFKDKVTKENRKREAETHLTESQGTKHDQNENSASGAVQEGSVKNVTPTTAPDVVVPGHRAQTTSDVARPFQDQEVEGLRLVHQPTEGDKTVADVVFVHGLTGHSDKTWFDKPSGVYWPSDLLPQDLPNIRVLAFDYDAEVTKLLGAVSQNDLRSHAEALLVDLAAFRHSSNTTTRPIIFVVHSLGGLVVKKSLAMSDGVVEAHLKQIGECTQAIAFLGTPHRGSDAAAFGTALANFLKVAGKRVNVEILELLKPNNQILVETEDSFGMWLRARPHIDVSCFYEELEMPGIGKVVPKDSAKLVGYFQIPIHATHRDMARFSSKTKAGYLRILGELRRWLYPLGSSWKGGKRSESAQAALRSLAFPEMNSRGNDVRVAEDQTCEWILVHPDYLHWLSTHQGLLWIKGKPGSGKSTLMKYALTTCESEKPTSCFVLLSFFFHGRGSKIQKSPDGLYRSVLHQLLDQLPTMLAEFTELFINREEKIGKNGVHWEWRESELRALFQANLLRATKMAKLRLYIDALDECGKTAARDLIALLQGIVKKLTEDASLQLIFSCRHYPILSLPGSAEITMEHENRGDIKRYVQRQLQLYITNETALQQVTNALVKRDAGIFLWIELMVSDVIELYLSGTRISRICKVIAAKPTHLYDLYRDLLQSLESDEKVELLQVVQWILFAMVPITLEGLRHALATLSGGQSSSLKECLESSHFETSEDLKRRLGDISRGLIECVANLKWSKFPTVRFIHQSVSDFMTDEGFRLIDGSFMSYPDFSGISHTQLCRICVKYIGFDEVREQLKIESEQLGTQRELLMQQPPTTGTMAFAGYARLFGILHAMLADLEGYDQGYLLAAIGWPRTGLINTWVNSIVSEYPSQKIFGIKLGMDLMHLACSFGITSIVKACFSRIDTGRVDISADHKGLCGRTPLMFAAVAGMERIVQMLCARKDVNINSRSKSRGTPIFFAASEGEIRVVRELLSHKNINVNLRSKGRSLLSIALSEGQSELAEMLLTRNDTNVNIRYRGKSLLACAIIRDNQKYVKMLLARTDTDINLSDPSGLTTTPLCWAAFMRRTEILKMLLRHPKIRVNKTDKWRRNALEWSMDHRFNKPEPNIVALLQDHGAKLPAVSSIDPLRALVALGEELS